MKKAEVFHGAEGNYMVVVTQTPLGKSDEIEVTMGSGEYDKTIDDFGPYAIAIIDQVPVEIAQKIRDCIMNNETYKEIDSIGSNREIVLAQIRKILGIA